MGCKKTGSEKIEPIATQPMKAPAATMTQRYREFMAHPFRWKHEQRTAGTISYEPFG
jgi:hypothetical protein